MLSQAQREALEVIETNDIKFIRLSFCDVFGAQKNLSIQSSELENAFEHGVAFDASSIAGFRDEALSDLFLFPDPESLVILPWRPSTNGVARFLCEIRKPDGEIFSADTRSYLRRCARLSEEKGLCCEFGSECEFYLFRRDDNGDPTDTPLDRAGYFDIAPEDRGENVRREICMTLEEMGIQPERSHHGHGPGQMEVDFRYGGALRAADDVITFKQVVATTASRNGLYASFQPKPLGEEPGNGFHVNISLLQAGAQLETSDPLFEAFQAGLLAHAAELSAVCCHLPRSYVRLGADKAPAYVSWSSQNRSQLVRIPAGGRRMEYRAPDAAANPYLTFALIIRAGLDGIDNSLELPEPCFENLFTAPAEILSRYAALPQNIASARALMAESAFLREVLPQHIFNAYTQS